MLMVRLLRRAARIADFVDQVLQVGADHAGRLRGDHAQVDVRRDGFAARVHKQNLLAAALVRPVDDHLAVEAAGSQQRRVEDVGAIGGRDDDDVGVAVEAVHLDQDLVERLLALVVAAAHARARDGGRRRRSRR